MLALSALAVSNAAKRSRTVVPLSIQWRKPVTRKVGKVLTHLGLERVSTAISPKRRYHW
ncbi:hypothetical protein KCP74_04710 [Salmonella enterica subsp. enterica]|nr:hypothetical protein KCP74_04710 [Salmonella enterica subsp. enterica]